MRGENYVTTDENRVNTDENTGENRTMRGETREFIVKIRERRAHIAGRRTVDGQSSDTVVTPSGGKMNYTRPAVRRSTTSLAVRNTRNITRRNTGVVGPEHCVM
jgi:hypothetical protein